MPIITWAVARLLAGVLSGTGEHVAKVIAYGALFAWAWLELFDGANYFRRALGLVLLLLLITSAARTGRLY